MKDYSKIEKFDYRIKNIFDGVLDLIEGKDKAVGDLQKRLDTATDFKPARHFTKYLYLSLPLKPWTERTYSSYGGYNEPRPVLTAEELREYLAKEEVIYEENKKISDENNAAHELAFAFLLKLGLKTNKTESVKRSYKTKSVECAWVAELRAIFPINAKYHYDRMKEWYKDQIEKIEKYNKEIQEKEDKEEKERQYKIKEGERTALIVTLTNKYGFKFNIPIPSPDDLLEELIKKNKYLYLAHYLQLNRGDWNDGYSYAETGLDFFARQPADKQDKEIIRDISSCFEDFSDGRVFRDCTWNYTRLFGIVGEMEPELSADYAKLVQYSGT